MKPLIQHNGFYENVACIQESKKQFTGTWHYHQEIEVLFIYKGQGSCLIGDFTTKFSSGDLFIIGSNLPHSFSLESDLEYESKVIILYFNTNFITKLPEIDNEFRFLKNVKSLSRLGLKFGIKNDHHLMKQLNDLPRLDKGNLSLHALAIISDVFSSHHYQNVGTFNSIKNENHRDERLQKITNFTISNFAKEINLNSVASIIGMNKSAFCRFFKQKTGKTYITFLNEIRINKACQILKLDNSNTAISSACFQAGFNNISYFHRLFKKYTGITPTEYIQV